MKTHLKEMWQDIAGFFKAFASDIKHLKQTSPVIFLGILAVLVLIIVGGISIVLIKSLGPAYSAERNYVLPTVLAVEPTHQVQATPQLTSTPTALPTPTPIPSNLWSVNQLLDPVNGALVVEFKNLSTGETKKGLCQSPNDPEPAPGSVFVAEIKDGYILLSPAIAGTNQVDTDSKVQRFIFIP